MGILKTAYTFILIFIVLTSCNGIIVYDCDDHNTNIVAVSIRDVAKCPEPASTYTSTREKVKVIPRNEIFTSHVWTCLIEVTRLISYCGIHSHSSVVEGGLSSYVYRLGAEECMAIHRYQTVQLYQQKIGNIVMNGTTTVSLTIARAVIVNGVCQGTTYHEQGYTWKNVVITAAVKIQARDYLAKVKIEEDQISLQGGITCPFLKSYCFDTIMGESVWKATVNIECETKLSVLYKGMAELVTDKTNGERYVVIETADKIFALTIKKGVM